MLNNISFKAKLVGIGNVYSKEIFGLRTKRDNDDYKMQYIGKLENTNWDIFQLSYKDKVVAKYLNIVNEEKSKEDYKAEDLLKIYRILRLKSALQLVDYWKKEKRKIKLQNKN